MPRVSVVVPVYDSKRYLEETLVSILEQTYRDYEIVVADHASTDGTEKILDRFSSHPRIRILEPTPKGGGAMANWNRVSRAASGDWLKLVCSDDLIAPDALTKQVGALEGNSSAVMVASRRNIIDSRGRRVLEARGLAGLRGRVDGREAIRATVRAGTNIFGEPACVLLNRPLLEAAGWWTEAFPYLLDEASYVNVLLRGDVVAIPEPLASFRVSAEQWSVRLAKLQSNQTTSFHRDLRTRHPDLLSRSDVAIGNLRARMNALGRRLVYLALARRMRH